MCAEAFLSHNVGKGEFGTLASTIYVLVSLTFQFGVECLGCFSIHIL
jgi:hypothetical protein